VEAFAGRLDARFDALERRLDLRFELCALRMEASMQRIVNRCILLLFAVTLGALGLCILFAHLA